MNKRKRNLRAGIGILILTVAVLLVPYRAVVAASDMASAQGVVDRARVTFSEFMRDTNYSWLRENVDHAKGILIFPQVLKGGFIFGGSGGTGVFVVRDGKTGQWSNPAFYTVGSVTFGLQIGGEAAELIMVAMTQRAVDSLLTSSFKLGGDTSIALGPVGAGAKASADLPSITSDFISFAKSKGIYGGLNLEGAVVAVRDGLNKAYYSRDVRPADIIVKMDTNNQGSFALRETLKCKC